MYWKTNHLNLNLEVIRDSNIQTFEGQLQSCSPYRVSLSRNQNHATAVIKQCWHLDSDTLRGLSHVHINSQTELTADVILSHSLGTTNTFCSHYPRPEIVKCWLRWTWWPRGSPYLNQHTQISSNILVTLYCHSATACVTFFCRNTIRIHSCPWRSSRQTHRDRNVTAVSVARWRPKMQKQNAKSEQASDVLEAFGLPLIRENKGWCCNRTFVTHPKVTMTNTGWWWWWHKQHIFPLKGPQHETQSTGCSWSSHMRSSSDSQSTAWHESKCCTLSTGIKIAFNASVNNCVMKSHSTPMNRTNYIPDVSIFAHWTQTANLK